MNCVTITTMKRLGFGIHTTIEAVLYNIYEHPGTFIPLGLPSNLNQNRGLSLALVVGWGPPIQGLRRTSKAKKDHEVI